MDAQVLIVGSGPVGLAAALGLSKFGVRTIILEKEEVPSRHSRAIVVWPRTAQIFESWGIIEPFLKTATFLKRASPIDIVTGKPILTMDFNILADLTPITGALILPQDETERILREAVLATGLCEIRFGSEVVKVAETESGVEVTVSHSGTSQSLSADYVLGCDGAHSRVREELGFVLEGSTYPQTVALADVQIRDSRDRLDWPRIDLSAGGLLAAIRFQNGTWRIIDGIANPANEPLEVRVRDRVRRLFGQGEFEPVWQSEFHIHNRVATGFRRGRIFLAGDAAHLNSPAGGQGMNGGLQDACDLSWKLGRVLVGMSGTSILNSYEVERRQVITKILNPQTDTLTDVILSSGGQARRGFLTVAGTILRVPAARRVAAQTATMMNMHVGPSPILDSGKAYVGTSMPDLSLSGGYLFESLFPDAALLLFDSDAKDPWLPIRSELQWPGLKVMRIVRPHKRATGEFQRASSDAQWWKLGTLERRAVLVRPDGVIAWQKRAPTLADVQHGVALALPKS